MFQAKIDVQFWKYDGNSFQCARETGETIHFAPRTSVGCKYWTKRREVP
jgi:hypothetical protein